MAWFVPFIYFFFFFFLPFLLFYFTFLRIQFQFHPCIMHISTQVQCCKRCVINSVTFVYYIIMVLFVCHLFLLTAAVLLCARSLCAVFSIYLPYLFVLVFCISFVFFLLFFFSFNRYFGICYTNKSINTVAITDLPVKCTNTDVFHL